MARYKNYDYGQMKLLPVSFEQQILPGTFEYTLNELIDTYSATVSPATTPTGLLPIPRVSRVRNSTKKNVEAICSGTYCWSK